MHQGTEARADTEAPAIDRQAAPRRQVARPRPDRGELDAEAFLRRRDGERCECGHARVSHGSCTDAGFVGVGRGPCGIDRDTRNAVTGYVGDPCPCQAFAGKIAP